MKYAAQTTVAADKSRGEIERLLARYGASSFMYGWKEADAVVMFVYDARSIRFELPMPPKNSKEFTHTPGRGFKRTANEALAAWEQATRQRWRALHLVIKAKLEAIESGISTFDNEFLAYTILPDGQTVSEWLHPQLVHAYEQGRMPQQLAIGGRKP